MSVIDILRSKELVEYIPDLQPFPDGTYRKRCDIHGGANPTSLTCFPDTNTFHCWSCGAGGEIFNYVMEKEGCSFSEAVSILADYYNIDISQDKSYVKQKSIAEHNEIVCRKYVSKLTTVEDYLRYKRGFSPEIIQQYKFGYSEKAQALTIPLYNRFGVLCSFSYRFLIPGASSKYKHGRNNELWDKSNFWFNLIHARKLIKKNGRIFLVEGHIDSISCQQQNEAALAYLGIMPSKEQVIALRKLLVHFGDVEIVLVPDLDGRAITHIPKVRQMFQKWYPEANLRVALMDRFEEQRQQLPDCPLDHPIKDMNDVLVAGLNISDTQTMHIDVFTCEYLMTTCSSIEQQYAESLKFIRTVHSELIKIDIAKMLAKRWDQELEDVKKHLSVSVESTDEKLKDFADVYDCFGALDDVLDEEEIGIGYPSVDSNVTFRKKWVVILGAYSFSGKTNNLIEWILHWVVRLHKRVLFFSLEMPKEDVIEVIMGKIMKIPPYKIKDTIRSPEGSQMYQKVAEVIQRYLYIVDKNSLSIDDIEDYIEVANNSLFDEPVDIVCVDYYQYLKGTTEYSDDSKTARKMKEIAKDNNIVLVMLSQFNKQSQYQDKGKVKEPTQNDLKGAGDIGASADVIYLIWRPALMGGLTEIEREKLEYITRLKIAKARKGLKHGVSHFELRYDVDTGCLEEISRKIS